MLKLKCSFSIRLLAFCDLERIVLKIRGCSFIILAIVEFNIIKLHLRGRYPRYPINTCVHLCSLSSFCFSLLNLVEAFIFRS